MIRFFFSRRSTGLLPLGIRKRICARFMSTSTLSSLTAEQCPKRDLCPISDLLVHPFKACPRRIQTFSTLGFDQHKDRICSLNSTVKETPSQSESKESCQEKKKFDAINMCIERRPGLEPSHDRHESTVPLLFIIQQELLHTGLYFWVSMRLD